MLRVGRPSGSPNAAPAGSPNTRQLVPPAPLAPSSPKVLQKNAFGGLKSFQIVKGVAKNAFGSLKSFQSAKSVAKNEFGGLTSVQIVKGWAEMILTV